MQRNFSDEGFTERDFPLSGPSPIPPGAECVYVFSWILDGVEAPFYVGRTERLDGRMNDYELAQFSASTDFRVGEAIKFFGRITGCEVKVRFRTSRDSRDEEKVLIQKFLIDGFRLLNCLPGYDYLTANAATERATIQKYCEAILRSSHAAPG